MKLSAESETLHRAVQRFAERLPQSGEFEELALRISRFQKQWGKPARCLLDFSDPAASAIPTEVFRLSRVAVHSPGEDIARFLTSGTNSEWSGCHPLRSLDSYRRLSTAFGRRALLGVGVSHVCVVALAPDPGESGTSSLAAMMRFFMEDFPRQGMRSLWPPHPWMVDEHGQIRLEDLRQQLRQAQAQNATLLILSTSLAFATLLDQLGGRSLPSADTRLMLTGGSKGRHSFVSPEEQRARAAAALQIPLERVVYEYGMTELSAQLYEGYELFPKLAKAGLYFEPPWLRVIPVDPITHRAVADGSPGLGLFIDLSNVDSALAVLSQDVVVRKGQGIRLLGRAPGSALRGCSLAQEALLDRRPLPRALPSTARLPALATDELPAVETDQFAARKRRVGRLIEIARRVTDPGALGAGQLRQSLVEETGLSALGVEAALKWSLELHPEPADIESLCRSVPSS